MKRTVFITGLIIVIFIGGLGLMNVLNAQTIEGTSDAAVMSKLSEIAKNQQIILQKLEDIKKELYVIKIRSTKR